MPPCHVRQLGEEYDIVSPAGGNQRGAGAPQTKGRMLPARGEITSGHTLDQQTAPQRITPAPQKVTLRNEVLAVLWKERVNNGRH